MQDAELIRQYTNPEVRKALRTEIGVCRQDMIDSGVEKPTGRVRISNFGPRRQSFVELHVLLPSGVDVIDRSESR